MNEAIIGMIRLGAAWIAGALLTWLVTLSQLIGGAVLPPETKLVLTQIVTLLFAAGYYFVVRWSQEKVPWLAWLLAIPKSQFYVKPQ